MHSRDLHYRLSDVVFDCFLSFFFLFCILQIGRRPDNYVILGLKTYELVIFIHLLLNSLLLFGGRQFSRFSLPSSTRFIHSKLSKTFQDVFNAFPIHRTASLFDNSSPLFMLGETVRTWNVHVAAFTPWKGADLFLRQRVRLRCIRQVTLWWFWEEEIGVSRES